MSVLNRVGHVCLVGHSCRSNSWIKLVDHSHGSVGQTLESNLGIILVGQTWGSFSWVILEGQRRRSNSQAFLVGQTRESFLWVILNGLKNWAEFLLADSDLIIAFVNLINFCRMEPGGSSSVFSFYSTLF